MIHLPPVPLRLLDRAHSGAVTFLRRLDRMPAGELRARFLPGSGQAVGYTVALGWQRTGSCDNCRLALVEPGAEAMGVAYPLEADREVDVEAMVSVAAQVWAEEWVRRNVVARALGGRPMLALTDDELEEIAGDSSRVEPDAIYKLATRTRKQASDLLSVVISGDIAKRELEARARETSHERLERLAMVPA